MNKIGQLTLESLLWYGAALLIVLLAIGALISFGVLDLGEMLPESCDFKGSGTFNCDDFKIDAANDEIQLQLTNEGTDSLTITGAEFVSDDDVLVKDCVDTGISEDLQPGESTLVRLDCTAGGGTIEANDGVRVTGEIELTHTLSGSSIEHVSTGRLSARAQE